ncbi:unannotated protein [freshwater metagenome]|uniref:Unannotated protein n=1 Tax=freshwater metagenome TaxID=449393 RepID=A0A6J7LAQ8_9ZZZZ
MGNESVLGEGEVLFSAPTAVKAAFLGAGWSWKWRFQMFS